jgi:hypothetical protein
MEIARDKWAGRSVQGLAIPGVWREPRHDGASDRAHSSGASAATWRQLCVKRANSQLADFPLADFLTRM